MVMGGHSPGEKGVVRTGSIGLEAQDLVSKVRSKEPLAQGAVGNPQKIVPGVGSAVDPGVHRHEHGKVRQRTVVPQNPIRFARPGVKDGEDVRPVALERHDGRGRVLAAQSDDPLRDARQGGLQPPLNLGREEVSHAKASGDGSENLRQEGEGREDAPGRLARVDVEVAPGVRTEVAPVVEDFAGYQIHGGGNQVRRLRGPDEGRGDVLDGVREAKVVIHGRRGQEGRLHVPAPDDHGRGHDNRRNRWKVEELSHPEVREPPHFLQLPRHESRAIPDSGELVLRLAYSRGELDSLGAITRTCAQVSEEAEVLPWKSRC